MLWLENNQGQRVYTWPLSNPDEILRVYFRLSRTPVKGYIVMVDL